MAFPPRIAPARLVASTVLLSSLTAVAMAQVQGTKPAPPPPRPKAAAPARPAAVPPTPPSGGLRQMPRTMPVPQRTQPQPSPIMATARPGVAPRPVAPAPAALGNTTGRGPAPARAVSASAVENHPAAASPARPTGALTVRPLPPVEAQQKLAAWNGQNRAALPGINSRPLPRGAQLQQVSNGRYVMNTPEGRNYGLDSEGRIHSFSHGDTRAAVDDNGRLQAVRAPNMLVKRTVAGERRVESRGQDNAYVVSYGPNRGFVERPVSAGGNTLIERTTVAGNSVTVTHYRDFSYAGAPGAPGLVLETYVPDTGYAPGYYAWLATPWASPVTYQPAGAPGPWAVAYAPYFQPEPAYASPTLWMTDQVIAGNLSDAYTARNSAPADTPAPPSTFEDIPRVSAVVTTPITRDIKVGVSQQFGQVLANDAQLSQGGLPPASHEMPAALDPSIQYFFVDDGLDVRTARGENHCSLSQGDALHLDREAARSMQPGSKEADLLVQSSLKGDCPSGTHVLVTFTDLQSMNNHCHESLSAAADRLQAEGGAHGLPASPPAGAHPVLSGLPPVDVAGRGQVVTASIADQQAESAKLEADTQQDLQASLR